MPRTGNDYRGQVLAAIDIVELIGRTVALKRRGRNYIGLCPFHQEKTPSFNVNPAKQYFYCFGCKAKGTAIDFVMKRDRVEFLDALRLLGEQAGIEMPQSGASKQKSGEKQALLDMQSAACAFFEKLLSHPEQGLAARQYLEQRRIDAGSIKRFQIGLAGDAWDTMLRALSRKFTAAQLEQGGLVKPRQNGQGYYDTFRNRLMFPIRDENARIIAFGGRVMPGSPIDIAKYLNSPETPLFSKSRCIFGIDLARQKMVESRTAVVVEGYTDVIVAHQFGASNVVSVLGTAMTEQHVAMLRRFVDRIVLLFDADSAGDTAVDRAVEVFLSQPVEIAIGTLPAGVDPDEFLLNQGADAFQGVVNGAADALSYKWTQLARQFEASDQNLTGQQKAVEAYLEVLASARGTGPVDAIRWGSALARVNRLTGIPVDDLNRRFKPRRTAAGPAVGATSEQPSTAAESRLLTAQDRAERWVLGILLLEPHRWHEAQQAVHMEDFANDLHRRLAEKYWNHQRDEGEPVFNQFLGLLEEPALIELAISAVEEIEALADLDRVLGEAFAYFERTRRVQDEQKLVASSRRKELDEVTLLRELSEKRRKADLWRT